ncbi:AMP-binding protein [Variovorax sp. J22P168]|uniref:AMP-binding protein n=1 Tax=Variovorax jilinensis TaxID=3053513 RepID=UPI002575A739|nr:AMP-binding protein [Variovorax sp. J22P168]MDM0015152.1 AMP-binding protein [Variovorax sp. J22P168]
MRDLRRNAHGTPDRAAIVCGDETWSYAALEATSNRMAAVLRSLGAVRGDHVASLIGNRAEAVALGWAAWRSGVYLTPMPTGLTVRELHYLVEDCDAKVVVADAILADVAVELPALSRTEISWLSLRGPIPGFVAMETLLSQASPKSRADETPGALMVYTSGTTGAPKGVFRPLLPADYRGTPPFAKDLLSLFGLDDANVRYLSTAPLYHAAPLRFALAVTAGGGTVYVMERFDADEALRLLEQHAITHSQWVPAMFQRLLDLPVERRAAFAAPAHRSAIHGAAPCPAPVKKSMIEWWGPIVREYYSGSEGVGLTLIDSTEALTHPGSVGRAHKGILHVTDEAGHLLPAGVTGLVYFSGVASFAYYKAPEKTAARTLPHGWQTFGDVGHVNEDGYLYLTDRQDDMIISGGVNVYPQEIEAAILSVKGVWDCAVVGVPDERFGERPVAFVVPARGTATSGPDTLIASVRSHCESHLGRIKRPSDFRVVESLPRSPTGKLLRRRLREWLAQPDRPAS